MSSICVDFNQNDELFKILQEKLFAEGYRWFAGNSTKVLKVKDIIRGEKIVLVVYPNAKGIGAAIFNPNNKMMSFSQFMNQNLSISLWF